MNKILKQILLTAVEVGKTAVPGGVLIDAGVHAIIDKDVEKGVLDTTEGAIKLIEGIKGVDIANETMFRQGVAQMEAGLSLVRMSLKKTETEQPA